MKADHLYSSSVQAHSEAVARQRGCQVRVLRDNIVIHEGDLASLRRFKDDVKEVQENYECGMQIEKFNDVKVGDIIECFVMEEIKQ